MSQLPIRDVVPKDSVGKVEPESRSERRIRIIGNVCTRMITNAVAITGFVMLSYVFFSEETRFDKYRDNAWPVLLTIIGAAVGASAAFAKKE